MQAERKTKKNKSIRDALPREGERNITDAFLQQKISKESFIGQMICKIGGRREHGQRKGR